MSKIFILNFKNYFEVSGEQTLELALTAQKVVQKLKINLVISPPQPAIALVRKSVRIPVFCQHIDDAPVGQSTGFIVPDIVKTYGISGSLINHSEHRLDHKTIDNLVRRLRDLQMTSVVCTRTPEEVVEIARLKPDFIAIEPPELIGSGKAVSKESPQIISDSISSASKYSNCKIICGAGITDKNDVRTALQLGVEGILVASGIIKSTTWFEKIFELASAFSA